MSKSVKFIIAGVLFLLMPMFASAGKDSWNFAKEEFTKNGKNNDKAKRLKATTALAEAIYPDAEVEAVRLLAEQIKSEVERSKGGSAEERVDVDTINACVQGLRGLTAEKSIKPLVDNAGKSGSPWRQRFYLIQAMGGINKPETISFLVATVDDKTEKLRIAAVDALAELGAKEGIAAACALLNEDIGWEVKIAALEYLKKVKAEESIEPLIKALGGKNIEGRVKADILGILRDVTGVNRGQLASSWAEWWEKKKKGEDVGNATDDGKTVSVSYYGIEVVSSRIIFILDISGSMTGAATWKEEEKKPEEKQPKVIFTDAKGKPAPQDVVDAIDYKKKEVDTRPVKIRMDAAKRELINTIYNLDPNVWFTMIFYSSGVMLWKDSMVQATAENKKAAIEAIDKQQPMGGTNTYDSLETAYKFADSGGGDKKMIQIDKKGNYAEQKGGIDTIFLVSDGIPNQGKIPVAVDIIKQTGKIHKIRRIKINTVAIGQPDPAHPEWKPDPDFLSKLAETTGGVFVDKSR
ncbi:MAG: HEAT repeat domain-containing protein [Planctomycetes bacterium]|nr:HEAT repeat domain-containing protein [Planctomycetota bacterium]